MSAAFKLAGPVELKASDPGAFVARIATLNTVDRDGDVTAINAFPTAKRVPVGAWGHASVRGGLPPVGEATLSSDGRVARASGRFFMDTRSGRDHYLTLRQLGGLVEWSYGYEVLDASTDYSELRQWPGALRLLKRLNVFEVAPVLVGAGVDTGTESIKACASCGRPHIGGGRSAVPADIAALACTSRRQDEATASLEAEILWSLFEGDRVLKA